MQHNVSRSRGMTLVEVLVSLVIISMLLLVIYHLLRQARLEIRKGLWLQATIADLRTATVGLSQRLKRATYPSTVDNNMVMAYKEWRKFDDVGRLRDIKVRDDKTGMDLTLFVAAPGTVSPTGGTQRLLLFPMCSPEMGASPGKITWVELWLEPESYSLPTQPRGHLRMIEYEDSYSTQGNPDRVFALVKQFSPTLPVISNKLLAHDIQSIEFDSYAVAELRGISVSETGKRSVKERKRYLLSLVVRCAHPQDNRITISDNCAVVNNIDTVAITGVAMIEVTGTNVGASPPTAQIIYNGTAMSVTLGQVVAGAFKVTLVDATSVSVETIPDGVTRTYFKK